MLDEWLQLLYQNSLIRLLIVLGYVNGYVPQEVIS